VGNRSDNPTVVNEAIIKQWMETVLETDRNARKKLEESCSRVETSLIKRKPRIPALHVRLTRL
jgi:hypothetical protein